MPRKAAPPVAPEFTNTREFISRYVIAPDEELDVLTMWAIGTHTFSPMCQWPATYPYLYVTGPAGCGKSTLCSDVLGTICRRHNLATGATGATLFRMLGEYNEETGEIDNYAPTLFMDEIDATFSGNKDESLRLSLNVGYKRSGSTIPRATGKTTIDFPVYGPKILAGIDNGHLPETVSTRAFRISLERHTADELEAAGVQEFYSWDADEVRDELQEQLSQWAKDNSTVLREYRPARPAGMNARHWEMGRSLVQLAHAMNIEARIVTSLLTVLDRRPSVPEWKIDLYRAISDLYDEAGSDRLTSAQILARLTERAIIIPGQSAKGLSLVLAEDGVASTLVHLPGGHPGIPESGQNKQRGYFKHAFDGAFFRYLFTEED